jgi:D-aminopeptidase
VSTPPPPRKRARDRGVEIGLLPPGPTNTIVDVRGVRVGHATCWHDRAGSAARTGVTAIVPGEIGELFRAPLSAGTAVLNGAGELTGAIAIEEWGTLETPILLTGTPSVGRALDAAVDAVFAAAPEAGDGTEDVMIPVVGECDDSWLDDARARSVRVEDARSAIDAATADPPALGVVGAGTGMISFGCKAGIGSASRLVSALDATVGVLVLANFGELQRLTIAGRAVGRELARSGFTTVPDAPSGSCIVVVATDAPLDGHACTRLARRAGLGLARVGSVGHHGSGEITIAFSTGARAPRRTERPHASRSTVTGAWLDPLFAAVVEATEESVVDALATADTVTGHDGRTAPALPL